MKNTVLVLGASGRFGRNSVQAFTRAGWRVRRFDRAQHDLETSVKGVDVVVSAWSPPGYHLWDDDLVALHAAVAKNAAARARP